MLTPLTPNDLAFVVARLPRDLRSTMIKDPRLMVGGGFIRATIAGERPSDIDVFGPSGEVLKLAAQGLALDRKAKIHESKNAITVLSPGRLAVQYITRWLYSDPAKLLKEFDFTIAQAVIQVSTSSGPKPRWVGYCSEGFYPDLAARRLVYTAPQREEDAGGSLLRARKFLSRGYNIQAPSLAGITARLLSAVDTAHAANVGLSTTQILTGLLREVDPLLVIDGLDVIDEHGTIEDNEAPDLALRGQPPPEADAPAEK